MVSPNPTPHYPPRQVFAWWLGSETPVPRRVPFVVDVCEGTFVHLERLMERASAPAAAAARPPAQEDECMMVAALRLLTLQVRDGRGKKEAMTPWVHKCESSYVCCIVQIMGCDHQNVPTAVLT